MADAAAQPAETPTEAPQPSLPIAPVDRPTTAPPAHQGSGKRPHSVRTIDHGSVVATPAGREGRTRELASSTEPVRTFTEHQRQMLENLDKHGDVNGPPGSAPAPAAASPAPALAAAAVGEPAKPAPDQPAAPAAAPAAPVTPPAPATPAADPDLAARAERLAEHNKRLVAEMEQLRAREPGAQDERMTALDEIERGLTTDAMGSLRKLVALNAGIKDQASPEVDRLMAGVYAEWTAHELKMQLDPAQRAAIGTDRNRLMIERDKREREAAAKAAEAKAAAEAQAQRDAGHIRELETHLDASKHAEKYPLLMKLARTIDKVSPAELLFMTVRRAGQAGLIAPGTPGDQIFDHYSKEIEKHYETIHQAHRALIPAPPTSTAPPAQATVPATDNTADATNTGVRTITNASASVAPPAPPAKPTPPAPAETPTRITRKPGESETAFRVRAAQARIPD